jgi:hypothetical protein
MRMVENAVIASPDLITASATQFTTDTNVIDMAQFGRVQAVLTLVQAGAGTGTVTLKQSSDAAGSDEKALAFSEYWTSADTAASSDLTRVEATALTTAGAATASNRYIFEIQADMLDVDGGFRYVRLDMVSLSNNTVASLEYCCYEPRYAQGATDMPEAIA